MNIYEEAIKKWGKKEQIIQTMEECAELIKACSKYFRFGKTDNVLEEMADVQLMLNQMIVMFGAENYRKSFNNKYNKLLKRLGINDPSFYLID